MHIVASHVSSGEVAGDGIGIGDIGVAKLCREICVVPKNTEEDITARSGEENLSDKVISKRLLDGVLAGVIIFEVE